MFLSYLKSGYRYTVLVVRLLKGCGRFLGVISCEARKREKYIWIPQAGVAIGLS